MNLVIAPAAVLGILFGLSDLSVLAMVLGAVALFTILIWAVITDDEPHRKPPIDHGGHVEVLGDNVRPIRPIRLDRGRAS